MNCDIALLQSVLSNRAEWPAWSQPVLPHVAGTHHEWRNP